MMMKKKTTHSLSHTSLVLFVFLGCLVQPGVGQGVTNFPPKLLNFQESRVIMKPEDTPIGSVIGSLSAEDKDGPQEITFSITDQNTMKLVRLGVPHGDSTVRRSVDIILNAKLDRDREPSERKMYFSVADGQSPIDHNEIPIMVSLYITDKNDEVPEFSVLRYKESVYENATVGTTVTKVTATDPDNGLGGTVSYSMQPVAQAADEEYKHAFRINPNTGDIIINNTLNFEKHNFYDFVIKAVDGDGMPSKHDADFVVTVLDIQDTPPSFYNLPYSVSMSEAAPVGSSVIQVTALDGDRGVPNQLTYTFLEGDYQPFELDASTGWITIKDGLDRDDQTVSKKGGVYAFKVKASEILRPGEMNYGPTTATTLVTVTVEDVNDNPPVFNADKYEAKILESMQKGVPVTLTGIHTQITVQDRDQGVNSHIEITLEKDNQPFYDFAPLPTEVFSRSNVLIRVNNSQDLDYEKTRTISFKIIAREKSTAQRRSSTADIVVHLEDMNDNEPIFNKKFYTASIPENSPYGKSVIQITARDADSGDYGKVTYSLRGGNGRFSIHNMTGVVSVSGDLDREKIDLFYLTIEAKDGGGYRSIAELEVTVTDENDFSPTFRRSDYYAIVPENSNTFFRGNLIVKAQDDDQALSNNSIVRYSIAGTPPGLEKNFSVNPVTGEISVASALDYESLDPSLHGTINVEVKATDLGNPPRTGMTNITIEVEDVNDNSPVFDHAKYTGSILENATDSTNVLQVHAVDADGTSLNNFIFYRIDSGAKDKFSINYRTGVISVMFGAVLDRESVRNYTLKVSATDRGETPKVGRCEVTIDILDVNDQSPFFSDPTRTVHITEAAGVGALVTTYTATDKDLDSDLGYRIVPGSISAKDENNNNVNITGSVDNYFSVVQSTGEIRVKSKMDRELAEQIILKILVTDKNAWKPVVQTATATLTVVLDDRNDNSPEFSKDTYLVNVSEAKDINDLVLTVSATDKDKNQIITYSIGTDSTNSFKVADTRSGMIQLRNKLDREKAGTVTFTVIATDNGSPNRMSSTATVVVTVTDINDQAPKFEPHQNVYSVREDAPHGKVIATITATDGDAGDFGKIFYNLIVIDDDGKLVINKSTGVISVNGALDRETRPGGYSIQITATDNEADDTNQEQTILGPIQINVLDVNDNAPTFTNIGVTPIRVQEIDDELTVVTATDPDTGNNAVIDFSLPGPTNTTGSTDWFTIKTIYNVATKQNEGKISVKGKLKNKVGVFYITVRAQDRGNTPQHTDAQLVFQVLDVNDNPPVFVVPKVVDNGEAPPVTMIEDLPIGTEVITVKAVDLDYGRNGKVEYFLSPEFDFNYFHLDNKTGRLTTTAKLDLEEVTHKGSYHLKIIAFDLGELSQQTTPLNLRIQLLDKNDKDPMFIRTDTTQPYVAGHADEETNSSFVGSVDLAIDEDSAPNNTIICYYLVGGDMKDFFHLSLKGNLTLTRSVDRENGPDGKPMTYVDLVVMANSNCYGKLGQGSNNPSIVRGKCKVDSTPPPEYDCYNQTLLWVRVMINDKNDYRPVFREKVMSIGVTRKTQLGEIIYKLHEEVTDKDVGRNAEHTFRNNSITFHPYPGTSSIPKPSAFYLFPNNGTVKTNMFFSSDLSGYYIMNVSVIDKEPPHYSDNAILRVTLVNDDQRVKVVFRNILQIVKDIKPEFKKDLERITGFRIVVDKIQTHENSQGKPEVDKTDMFIHAEDRNTSNIIEAAELLNIIDAHTAELNAILNKYNILRIVPTTQTEEADESQRLLLMAIILLAIVLGIPCIVLSIVLYISRKKYQRKLKAATAMAYGSKDADMQKLEMPGTNLHSYENANPIFMEKVLLEEVGEQEDDSIDDNEVGPAQDKPYDVQEKSINFLGESDRNSAYGPRDMNLKAVLKAHEMAKNQANGSHKPLNGHAGSNGMINMDALPATEI